MEYYTPSVYVLTPRCQRVSLILSSQPEVFPTKDRGTGNGLVATANRIFGVMVRSLTSADFDEDFTLKWNRRL
jgi:hypothetical protein